ncbi:hypothetical protein LCGC14_2199090, partial [marine sediment metagenome]
MDSGAGARSPGGGDWREWSA